MKKVLLTSILAVAVMTISGCSVKSSCGTCTPSYPACEKPVCGCK